MKQHPGRVMRVWHSPVEVVQGKYPPEKTIQTWDDRVRMMLMVVPPSQQRDALARLQLLA